MSLQEFDPSGFDSPPEPAKPKAARSPRHIEALRLVREGVRAFPLAAGSKVPPAGSSGFKDASADAARVNAWWRAGDHNLAMCPADAGLFVLDVDPRSGGDESLAALEAAHGALPATYTVRTPSGGRHLYFKGSAPSSVGRLGRGLDIRGVGGYVVLPPSFLTEYGGAAYEIADNRPHAEPPAWLVEAATAAKQAARTAPTNIELDRPLSVAAAKAEIARLLDKGDVAIEGQGGDTRTYKLAARMGDLGLSEVTAAEILEPWNAACNPPWEPADFAAKIAQGYKSRQNALGCDAPETAQEAFGEYVEAFDPAAEPQRQGARIVLRDEAMQDARPPIEWLIEGFLPDGGTVAIHAPFNSYKSFAAAEAVLSVAAGNPAFGKLRVRRQGPTIYMLGEGAAGFETQRRPAWRTAREIAPDRLLPVFTIEGVPPVRSQVEVAAYVEAIDAKVREIGERPALIVIDTMARAMAGLNENDAGDAAIYLNTVEEMARRFRCCVLSILHEGKESDRGARGSSAFPAGFDNLWQIEADTEGLTAQIRPVKLKDDAGVSAIHLKGRQVQTPGRKPSLVFDVIAGDDYRKAAGKRVGITNSEIGRALKSMGVVDGGDVEPVTTHVLAMEIAGAGAARKVVEAKARNLRAGARARFRVYVAHHGAGRNDPTLWHFPNTCQDASEPAAENKLRKVSPQ